MASNIDEQGDVSSSDEETMMTEKKITERSLWKYQVLGAVEIVNLMNNEIKQIIEIIKLPPIYARILLNHCKWDKDKLIEKFFDDNEKMFNDAKIPKIKYEKINVNPNLPQTCGICFDDFIPKDMISLECNDWFCRGCYQAYIKTKIVDEGNTDKIKCIAPQCNLLVGDEIVIDLINDEDVKKKYLYLITNNFVDWNRLMKWCPAPNCARAITVMYLEKRAVKCHCGYAFCFDCMEIDHDPIKCETLTKWKSESFQSAEEAKTLKWLAEKTKKCPNCKSNIEKDGGCNHMTCKACNYEFCWICFNKWSNHPACNTYQVSPDNQTDVANKSYERYIHFYERYENHRNSLILDKNLFPKILSIQKIFVDNYMSWVEVEFLKKAHDVLCECRRTLMNTYIFGYYLKQNNHALIFEDNQRDLEIATENLSSYLEHDINDITTIVKQDAQNKYIYCEQRRNALIDYVYVGYEEKLWN